MDQNQDDPATFNWSIVAFLSFFSSSFNVAKISLKWIVHHRLLADCIYYLTVRD